MSTTAKNYMLTQLGNYFSKVKGLVAAGGSVYETGSIQANSSVVYDSPTKLDFSVADSYIYSMGIDLKIEDPDNPTPMVVIPATAKLDYQITTDGKVTIRNFTNAVVKYHLRISKPLAK